MYRLFEEALNWTDARAKCQLHGGDLISITSKEEEKRIQLMISKLSSDKTFWCGLNDRAKEGEFVWSDGSEYSYKNWRKDEPNNMQGEDCTVSTKAMDWNDLGCEHKQYFMCKNLLA